jgi:hypothetical protein
MLITVKFPSSLIQSTPMMETICRFLRIARRHIPGDGIIHNHRRQDAKSDKTLRCLDYRPGSNMSTLLPQPTDVLQVRIFAFHTLFKCMYRNGDQRGF